MNFFQPAFRLIDKTRDSATTVKHCSQPRTPCDRLIQHEATSDEVKYALKEYRARLDPVLLLHTIREARSPWWRRLLRKCVKRHRAKASVGSSPSRPGCAVRVKRVLPTRPACEVRGTGGREKIPSRVFGVRCWSGCRPNRMPRGEARPTHAARMRGPRHWRTRNDPFEGVWGEVLVWLQAEPDATGKALIARLQSEYPDRFTEAQLQTMQRRVKEWRGIMAKELIHAGTAAASTEPDGLPEQAPIRVDARC